MRIAELARLAGVKVSTVRFYERSGLLAEPARTSGGYRDYSPEDAVRLRFLRRGQELGFTLAELHDFDRLSRASRAAGATAGDVADEAQRKLREIDAKIADLQRTRSALAGLLEQQCLDPSVVCPVVDALGGEREQR